MKHLLIALRFAFLAVVALAAAPAAHAQVNISIGPPSWGPAVASGQQYYYIPETNGFYDVPARQHVVRRDGRWIRTSNLSGYNTANFHPVIVDYVGAQPWSRYDEYRTRYPRGNGNGQYDDRRYERRDDDRRYELRDDDRDGHNDDRRYERRDDDNGKYKDKGKGKGKGKN
jgi:hypothetical protein